MQANGRFQRNVVCSKLLFSYIGLVSARTLEMEVFCTKLDTGCSKAIPQPLTRCSPSDHQGTLPQTDDKAYAGDLGDSVPG